MQTFKAKKNFQIESLLIDGDFLHNPSFFSHIESKRDLSLNFFPMSKPPLNFSEKVHSFDEYIEIADAFFLKNLQSTIETHTPRKYEEFIIQNDDTLYGIALKLDVNIESIKNFNFLNEDSQLFPGQIILIPTKDKLKSEEIDQKENKIKSFMLNDLKDWLISEENPEEIKEIENIEHMISKKKSLKISQNCEEFFKYEVYYCTSYGDIKGILTINEFSLMFDPLGIEKNKNRSLDFQVLLDLNDIIEAFMMNLPNKYCDEQFHNDEKNKEFNKDFFLEINVSRIGDQAIENKYKERINAMSKEKLPLATIFFKIYDHFYEAELNNTKKYTIALEIQKKLSELMKFTKGKNEKISTKIPFFDILYENLFKTSAKKTHKNYKTRSIIKNLTLFGVIPLEEQEAEEVPDYIPKLIEDSHMLTNEHFLQILDYIPPSLKLRNWKLVYSNAIHGMSLNTIFTKCEEIGPNILVIQDFKGWVFGAFCSESWVRSQNFYGKGETFLFSFRKGKKINSFTWTGKNYEFQFADSEGLALGMGEKYGLYVKGDLLKGSSYLCETFDNEVLSEENEFEVRFLEIWGCDEFIDI